MKRLSYGVSWVLFVSSLYLVGCSSTGTSVRSFDGKRAVKVPPGVRPLVAVRADSIAAGLFVSMKLEREAQALFEQGRRHYEVSDSMWTALDAAKQAPAKSVSKDDSVAAIKQAIAGAGKLQEVQKNFQNYERTQDQRLIIQASYNLKEAQKNLEKSVQLNPFNTQVQNFLALTYKLLAVNFPKEMSYEKSLRIWGALARLEPGEPGHYYNLGDAFLAAGQWQEALENFKKCEEVILATAEVNPQRLANPSLPVEATMDTTMLFLAVFNQARAAVKLFDDKTALQSLKRAKELTHVPAYLEAVESTDKWINWDDGNILGAVMRDSANALANRGKLVEAGKIYEDLITGILKTQRTKDEVSWIYARIEFTTLNRKASAVARLYEVVQGIAKDAGGAPLDTTYTTYFDAYGTMCHNLGTDTLRSDRKLAYTYFSQSADVNWKGRGKSYLSMTELSRGNPELMVANGEKAVALADQLTPDELQALYKLLVDGYRRLRQPDKAKFYFDKVRSTNE
jgi:tetratricopeptide (TPR) repeat protein